MHILSLLQAKRALAGPTPLAAATHLMQQEGGVVPAGRKPQTQQPFISCLLATVQIGHVPGEGGMFLKKQHILLSEMLASYLHLLPTGHLRLK